MDNRDRLVALSLAELASPLQDVINSCAQAAMHFLQKSSDTLPDLDTSGAHSCCQPGGIWVAPSI